jgi:hypothetical protein
MARLTGPLRRILDDEALESRAGQEEEEEDEGGALEGTTGVDAQVAQAVQRGTSYTRELSREVSTVKLPPRTAHAHLDEG